MHPAALRLSYGPRACVFYLGVAAAATQVPEAKTGPYGGKHYWAIPQARLPPVVSDVLSDERLIVDLHGGASHWPMRLLCT